MRKRSFHLIAYLIFCFIASAQTNPSSFDSTWFDNYFKRQIAISELNDPIKEKDLMPISVRSWLGYDTGGATLFVFAVD